MLIDCEEDRTLRAVLVGMLREGDPTSRRRKPGEPLGWRPARREVTVDEEQELTFQEMLLSDIAADVGSIRRNRGFLVAVVLVYLVVVGLSFPFVLFANVTQ